MGFDEQKYLNLSGTQHSAKCISKSLFSITISFVEPFLDLFCPNIFLPLRNTLYFLSKNELNTSLLVYKLSID